MRAKGEHHNSVRRLPITERGIHVPLLAALSLLLCAIAVHGQENHLEKLKAPPPLRVLATDERNVLTATTDSKERVKKTIVFAEGHLTKAEGHTSQEQYTEASADLGRYWALIEDVLTYLGPFKRDSNKTRDLYKRLELSLRAHGPRLTNIRRNTPQEYGVWIKEIEEFARASRTEALNSFYGQTVVREPKPKSDKPEKRPIEALAPPENKP
jgi:hypothetical protein